MPAPPFVRRRLWPPGRRILPTLLTSIRRRIEEAPDISDGFGAASGGEVGAVDLLPPAQEDRKPMTLLLGGGQPEIRIEAGLRARHPAMRPAHALAIRFDIRKRRTGDERQRDAPGLQVLGRELADIVDEHRASRAPGVGPAMHARREHEMIEEELRPPV